MTHGPSFAAAEAHLIKLEMAAVPAIHAKHPALAAKAAAMTGSNSTGGGNDLGPQAGSGQFQPVSNTYSNLDINSNYIGGSVGLQAFVDGLYTNVLHRAPDPAGEAFWTGTLESGQYTPYTVVSYFLISSEAVQAGGSGQALQPTHPPSNIYTSYLGGPIGVQAFVDGLYEDVLQRTPDPAGEAYWADQIENHDLLPAKITFSFLAAAEYQNQLGA